MIVDRHTTGGEQPGFRLCQVDNLPARGRADRYQNNCSPRVFVYSSNSLDPNSFFGKKGHAIFDGEINDLKSLDEALELGVVKERGKGLVAL
jgi:hypothetical protein